MKDERQNHQRVFGETPEMFAVRVARTLTGLKEDRPMKKGISGAFITVIVLILLCAAAVAAVNGVGLEWFYKNIFPNHPLPEDLGSRIQSELFDTAEHPLLSIKVESAAWLPKGYDRNFPDAYLLEVLVSVRPKDPEKYEVHAWDSLNDDGERENRELDFITTPKGMGPVSEVMLDPKKALLLYGKQPITYLTGSGHGMGLGPGICIYAYDPDGNLLVYCSYPISDDAYNSIRTMYADGENSITLHYKDESWLWNAGGAMAGFVQSGSAAFTVKLPE